MSCRVMWCPDALPPPFPGLVNKELGNLSESLQAFEKLHTIIPSAPEVIYQIANLHDLMGHYAAAAKYFNYLISKVPSDPGALARLGQIFAKDEDETQAFHYHHESYRYFPVNLDVISWLGVWFVKSELYEKAIEFFERASEIQPDEVKWKLMVTSCYRRMGSLQKAMDLYETIHKKYPDNLECLRYLVAICKDLGRGFEQYQAKLVRLERSQAQSQGVMTRQAGYGGGSGGGGGGDGGGGAYGAGAGAGAGAGMYAREPARSPPREVAEESRDSPMMAPSAAGGKLSSGGPSRLDEDDFADADLDDLLAE